MISRSCWLVVLLSGIGFTSTAHAQSSKSAAPESQKATSPSASESLENPSDFSLTKPEFRLNSKPEKKRNTFIPPLASYFLPGLDQWWEGQYGHASVYTGLGVAGTLLIRSADYGPEKFADLGSRDPEIRKALLGGSLYSLGGGLSSYHSFHTAISNQRKRYDFISPELEETPTDLALAPFHFSFITRHTTWIPIGIAVGLTVLATEKTRRVTFGDVGMAGVMSYSAGVNEEAAFRGFLLPWLRAGVGTDWGSNLITSVVFAAAHYSSDLKVPLPQFLMGYYLGYLTQANDWTLAESIFVHTWWDVVAFMGDYIRESKVKTILIGPLQFRF